MIRRAPLLLALLLVACGHAPPADQPPPPVVAVVTPSAPASATFTPRHRLRLNLEAMRLDRGKLHRDEVLAAVRKAEAARLARSGYRLAPEADRAAEEETLTRMANLDRATVRRALHADLLLLTTVTQWEEPTGAGMENAVTCGLDVSLYDLRDGHLVWRNRIQGALVRTMNELDTAVGDLARAAVAEALRSLPAP